MKIEFKKQTWGIGSAGRAPALHAGGQEFESPILHHYKKDLENRPFFIAQTRPRSGLCIKKEVL